MKRILFTVLAVFMVGANLFADFVLPSEFTLTHSRLTSYMSLKTETGIPLAYGSVVNDRYQLLQSTGIILANLDYHPFQDASSSACHLFVVRDNQNNILGSLSFTDMKYSISDVIGFIFDKNGSRVGYITHDSWDINICIEAQDNKEPLVLSVEKASSMLRPKMTFKAKLLGNTLFEDVAIDSRVILAILHIHGNPQMIGWTTVKTNQSLIESDLPNLTESRPLLFQ